MILIMAFLTLFAAPIAVSATLYAFSERAENWMMADRSSAGLLPPPSATPEAAVRIYAARTVRWKQIFAVAQLDRLQRGGTLQTYTRYDYTAWGEPIRGQRLCRRRALVRRHPETIFAADGEAAER